MKHLIPLLLATAVGHGQIPIIPGAELGLVADGYKFTEGPASDATGNVYFTDPYYKRPYWQDRETPDQEKLGEIPNDRKWTANVTFGGPEMKSLFITAMDSVFTLEMAVKGTR